MQLEKRLKIITWLRKRLAIDYKNDLSLKQFYIHDYRLNTNTSFKYNINLSRSLLHFHSTFYFPHLTFRGYKYSRGSLFTLFETRKKEMELLNV